MIVSCQSRYTWLKRTLCTTADTCSLYALALCCLGIAKAVRVVAAKLLDTFHPLTTVLM